MHRLMVTLTVTLTVTGLLFPQLPYNRRLEADVHGQRQESSRVAIAWNVRNEGLRLGVW